MVVIKTRTSGFDLLGWDAGIIGLDSLIVFPDVASGNTVVTRCEAAKLVISSLPPYGVWSNQIKRGTLFDSILISNPGGWVSLPASMRSCCLSLKSRLLVGRVCTSWW